MQLSTRLGRVRTYLDVSQSPLRTRPLRCHLDGELVRVTTSLLLRSSQIQTLDRLLDQSVIGHQILYSQSVMVINANANGFTHLSCSQWEDTTFEGTCHKRHVNDVLGNLMRLHYLGEVPRAMAPALRPRVGPIMVFLLTQRMELLSEQCGATSR
jgi:hypothetical protein